MSRVLQTITTSASVVAISTTTLWANSAETSRHHDMMWGAWGGMILGPLMMIIFIAVIVVIVVIAIRWLGSAGSDATQKGGPTESPIDILKERFARGEIDRADFEERRQVLEQ